MQDQGLESLKAAQAAYLQSLAHARQLLEAMPPAGQMPTIESMPTIAQLTEMNTKFVENVVEQQKAYAQQLSDALAPISKTMGV